MANYEQYKIFGDTMDQIAYWTRVLSGVQSKLTPEEIIYWLSQVAKEQDMKVRVEQLMNIISFINTTQMQLAYPIMEDVLIEMKSKDDMAFNYEIPNFNIFSNRINFNYKDSLILDNHSGDPMLNYETYNTRFVKSSPESVATIINEWRYDSENESIDSGTMNVVKTITDDLINVNNISIIKMAEISPNMNEWSKNPAATIAFSDISYNNNINNCTITGCDGHEIIAAPVILTAGVKYTFSLDYYNPNGVNGMYDVPYAPYIAFMNASDMVSNNVPAKLAYTRLQASPMTGYQTYTCSFKPTTSGNYVVGLCYGSVEDFIEHNFFIKNISIIEE